ncbi:cysteine hydrolase family protein [Blastococcus sp. PRF04-17]|uniref:cysteine hydrolase family protein n=1 Tax=Blastococcus sp. PRF04-17 TaxID=2933797 RepID=UPI001FF15AB7|nr:isochorismatase family cysteine hydrolase [Blastococcus sp. PRF04-17]UOY03186.1 cysteine hydrolase [Blastococcus sp. PRF04-17]
MELDPRTTAVVAVHYQGDIVGPDGAFAGFFHQQVAERNVLDVTKGVLDAARAAGVPVVYTRVAWQPDYSDLNANSPLLGIVAQSGCLKDGSPLADIVAEVAPGEGDEVVTHKRVGGFTDSGLHELLQSRGVQTVLFTGVATNASVEGTARQASDLGYRVIVVEDACSAATPAAHQASIESLGLLAEIASAADITTALSAKENAPA